MRDLDKWLNIVDEDFCVAKLATQNDFFSSTVYHCQQSAEKMLKAYFVVRKQDIKKTHDLLELLKICLFFDQDFKLIFDSADYLNPFSTKFTYPTDLKPPDLKIAKLAIKHARKIMNFVLKKFSDPKASQRNIFIGER